MRQEGFADAESMEGPDVGEDALTESGDSTGQGTDPDQDGQVAGPTWMSRKTALERLGVSARTLRRLVQRGEVERRRVGRAAEYRVIRPRTANGARSDTAATDGLLSLTKQLVGSEAGRAEALAQRVALEDERDALARDLSGVIGQRDALKSQVDDLQVSLDAAVEALKLSNVNVRQMHDVIEVMVERLDAVASSPLAFAVRGQIRAIAQAPATVGAIEL